MVIKILLLFLAHLHPRLDRSGRTDDHQATVGIFGAEYHALALYSHHLARSEVGDEEHILAHEVIGLVVLGNAREDGTVGARAVVDGKL